MIVRFDDYFCELLANFVENRQMVFQYKFTDILTVFV